MFHKNCLQREAQLSAAATHRLNALDHGGLRGRTESRQDRVARLLPGACETLFCQAGAGCVETLVLRWANFEDGAANHLRIRIYFDGSEAPQVSALASDFFLSGRGGRDTQSDYFGKSVDDAGWVMLYRHIAMPYRAGCRIEMVNQWEEAIEDVALRAEFIQYEQPVDLGRAACLHSVEHLGRAVQWGQKFVLLDCAGAGALHSIQLSLANPLTCGQFMEGNFEIYIDDNSFPEYQSTGTEEFFMGGIYFTNLHNSAYSGCTRTFLDGGEDPEHGISAHRLFIKDPITFTKRLRIVWSHGQPGQGTVVGPTEVDFSALYYTEAAMPNDAPLASAGEAELRLDLLDGAAERRPLRAQSGVAQGDEAVPVIALEGAGTLERLALEVKEGATSFDEVQLRFVIDGEPQDPVPAALFLLADDGAKAGLSEHGGLVSETFGWRRVRIAYEKRLALYLDAPEGSTIGATAEWRQGRLAGMRRSRIICREIAGRQTRSLPIAQGQGFVQQFALSLGGVEKRGLIELWDSAHAPLMVAPMDEFFLVNAPGGEQHVNRAHHAAVNDGKHAVCSRFFPGTLFRFQNGLEMKITGGEEAAYTALVLLCETEEPASAAGASVLELNQRIHRLDGARDQYEQRCYNPVETDQYYPKHVEGGQAINMLEDFGPGMITCLRFGTPSKGSALHEAKLRFYFNGEETPSIDTTCARFFSSEYGDPLFWSHTSALARPSQRGWNNAKNQGQHTSFFRYIRMPYQDGCRIEMVAPEDSWIDGFDNVYYAAAHDTGSDFGLMNRTEDITFDGVCAGGERTLIAQKAGRCLVTSVQLMLRYDDMAAREGIITLADGDKELMRLPLHTFFMAPAGAVKPHTHEYLPMWREMVEALEGGFSAPDVGWVRRGVKAPYRDVVYRLFEDAPLCFGEGMKLFITMPKGVVAQVQADILAHG